MEGHRLNKQDFLVRLIERYIQISEKGRIEIDKLYYGYRILIDNQIHSRPEERQECEKLLEVLEKVYTMFKNQDFRQSVVDSNITYQQFVMKYGEDLLGDNKRKYDMSDRFDPGMIASEYERPENKKVRYVPREGLENRYLDLEGKEVIIQEIGTLDFQEWNGLYSNIYKYRISKQVADGSYQESEVFSYIVIANMEEPQYREAVLGELLSENNIQLSKSGGYIGKIRNISNNDSNDFKIGSEKTISTNYFYRINSKYALEYNSEELSAAMIQEQIDKKQQSREGDQKKANCSRNTGNRIERYKKNFRGTEEER